MSSGLFGSLSANGTIGPIECVGDVHVHMSGSFGSGTITWYMHNAGVDYALKDGAFTAADDKLWSFPPNARTLIKGVLAGSTTPTFKYAVRSNKLR